MTSLHPLKIVCLLAWLTLLAGQVSLLLPISGVAPFWVFLLAPPLLLPLRGLLGDSIYTYRWVGFLTLVYFCVGISELMTTPNLKLYAFATIAASLLLFLASIYYARYLALRRVIPPHTD